MKRGNCYGTSFKAVEDVSKLKKICVLDLEVNGVKALKKAMPDSKFMYVKVCIYSRFIQPPSIKDLESRLRSRKTESEESLQKRLQSAQEAMDFAKSTGAYDVIIVNDALETAYHQLKEFVQNKWNL